MKKRNLVKKMLFATAVVGVLAFAACKKEVKAEDPKEAAEKQNEARLDNKEYKEDVAEILVDEAEFELFQVQMGKLGSEKGTAVKEFAKMLVNHHGENVKALNALAQSKEVSLPAAISADQQSDLDKLAKERGADFDRKFINRVIEEHNEAIDEFTKDMDATSNAEVKAWLDKVVTLLRGHLAEATKIQDQLKK